MTGRGIREFMWGFQPHFRTSSEDLVNGALLAIGLAAAPEVLLVGFREKGSSPNPICVEPEDGKFPSSLFTGSMADADQAFQSHPDRQMLTWDARLHDRRTRRSLEKSRRAAIEVALLKSLHGEDKVFFVGVPAMVGDYRVYPVVSVLKARWETAPTLPSDVPLATPVPGNPVFPLSLHHSVVRTALNEMTLALSLAPEPEGLRTYTWELKPEVVRHAAAELVRGIVVGYGNEYGGELFEAMNALSAQPYEGRTGIGTLLINKPGRGLADVQVEFKKPIHLSATRALRKALEMTGPDLSLLIDGIHASGLGRAYDTAPPGSLFEVTVTGRGQWALGTLTEALLAVENGSAMLPRDRISKAVFVDTVNRVFNHAGDGEALWSLTEAASRQQHGTMLVVHIDAEGEAQRLAPQALAISPRVLSRDHLASLTAIDGAILVAPDAKCYAVGVILDGQAVAGVGDASRGARYNSALRYHEGSEEGSTLIVIVSEDGMINLLPTLNRRVSRASVLSAMDALVAASKKPVDFERAARAAEHVRSLSFYLSTEQASAANDAFEAIELAREQEVLESGQPGITRVSYTRILPDARMNESYFLN